MTLDLICPQWPAPQRVKAFSTTRVGGHSQAPYDSLNVGEHVGDSLDTVQANRKQLPLHQNIKWLNQVHGNSCISLDSNSAQNMSFDASTTSEPNLVCAVMTADCLPILLCNKQGTEVAAVHAGWKGLADGVIENSCNQMHSAASELIAWIGPHISQKNFEVDDLVFAHFQAYPDCFLPTKVTGKYQANLQRITQAKLSALGIKQIFSADMCTYENEALFFSHRRATHQGLTQTGRMVTGIYLQP